MPRPGLHGSEMLRCSAAAVQRVRVQQTRGTGTQLYVCTYHTAVQGILAVCPRCVCCDDQDRQQRPGVRTGLSEGAQVRVPAPRPSHLGCHIAGMRRSTTWKGPCSVQWPSPRAGTRRRAWPSCRSAPATCLFSQALRNNLREVLSTQDRSGPADTLRKGSHTGKGPGGAGQGVYHLNKHHQAE